MRKAIAALLAWVILIGPWAQYAAHAGPQAAGEVAASGYSSHFILPRVALWDSRSTLFSLGNQISLTAQPIIGSQTPNLNTHQESPLVLPASRVAVAYDPPARAFPPAGSPVEAALLAQGGITSAAQPFIRITRASPSAQNSSLLAQPLKRTLAIVSRLGTLAASESQEPEYRGSELYDGAPAENPVDLAATSNDAPVQHRSAFKRFAGATLGRLIPNLAARWGWRDPPPPKDFDRDSYGGPRPYDQSLQGRVLAGLKTGMNMLGIGAIMKLAIAPLLASVPWPLWVPDSWLQVTGRVHLMTRIGPAGVSMALMTNPLRFLLWDLPRMALQEEIAFRLIGFGLWFLILVALKPLTSGLSKVLDRLPDLFGIRSAGQWFLGKIGKISQKAFWIAASLSALNFAVAHFALWGINPYTLLTHIILGLILTYAAYRSQSLLVPFIAHYFYNLTNLLLGPGASQFLTGASLTSLGYMLNFAFLAVLFYNWRAYRKDLAAAWEQTKERHEPAAASPSWGLKNARRTLWELAALLAPLAAYAFFYSKFFAATMATNQFLLVIAVSSGTMLGVLTLAAIVNALQHRIRAWLKSRASNAAGSAGASRRSGAGALLRLGVILALINAVPLIPWAFKSSETQPPQIRVMFNQHAAKHLAPVIAAKSVPQIIEEAGPSVVMVIVNGGAGRSSIGTGFIVDKNGLLATNNHVVAEAEGDQVLIRLHNGRIVPAKILSKNAKDDLALVQLPPALPAGWPALRLGDSTKLNVGDRVLALGHPHGLEHTATEGILSGRGNRSGVNPGDLSGFLQVDAAINHGNSGGPLLNMSGEVVGINTAKIDSAQGLGFSREVEYLKRRLEQYRSLGNIHSAWLGAIINLNPVEHPAMLRVEHVWPDSPAAKYGLQPGDAILGINNVSLSRMPAKAALELDRHIANFPPSHPVALIIQRGYQQMTLNITLGDETARPESPVQKWLDSLPSFSWDQMFSFEDPSRKPAGN